MGMTSFESAALVSVLVFLVSASVGCAATVSESKAVKKRVKAPYTLLYNNDTTNTAGCRSPYHKKRERFTEKKLVASIEEVAGKGVDCYLLSPGMGWVPWWQSKVEPDFYEWWMKRTGLKTVSGNRSGSGYETYVYNGGDMVQVLIDTCRKHNMAPFVSLRLNDVHAQECYRDKTQRSIVSCRFYCEHPEWHIDPEHYKRKGYYGKRGMDWAVPQVRAYKLKLIAELADKYDLAGLELDFLRHSQLFRDNGPTPRERIRVITGFVSKVRKALDRKGGKRKWLCVRIPLLLSRHPELGLDVKKLHAAGVDMFNLSGWYHTTQNTDAAKVRKLVPGAAIYVEMTHVAGRNPHFHKSRNYGTNPCPRTSDQQFYTTARLARARGADGVSLFNFVYYRMFRKGVVDYREPPFHVLPGLVDRKFLAAQPPYYWLGDASYVKRLPRRFKHGQSLFFGMDMLPVGKGTELRLRVHFKEVLGDRKLVARFNGRRLNPVADLGGFYGNPFDTMITPSGKHRAAWALPAEAIRDGRNELEVRLESGQPATIIWIDAGASGKAADQRNSAKRRGLVLYLDDLTHIGSCVSPYRRKKRGERFSEAMLIADVDEVADAGADIHLLQPGLGWSPLWKSKVLPFRKHHAWIKKRYGCRDGFFDAYMLGGGDIVGAFVKRCRERGTQPYVSLRMNDYHHKEVMDLGPEEFKKHPRPVTLSSSRFQMEHKDWRLGPETKESARLLAQLKTMADARENRRARGEARHTRVLNWAVPEVRQHKLAFITEICENYDIDGFELDFMRYARLFRKDKTSSRQRLKIMTGFCRKVRKVLDRTSPGGRRRRLCVRIPHHSATYDELGIDIAAWHAAGVDMFNLSCFYSCEQQTQLPRLAALAPDAEFFLEMTQTTLRLHGRGREQFRMTTPEQFTTAAAVAAAQGASGMSLFNFMYYRKNGERPGVMTEPPFAVFRLMKKAMQMPPAAQHYFFGPGSNVWRASDYVLPVFMKRGRTATFRLTMAPPPGGWKKPGRLRIQTRGTSKGRSFKMLFNGQELSRTSDTSEPFPSRYNNKENALGYPEELRAWRVPVKLMKKGKNTIQLTQTEGGGVEVLFVDVGVSETEEAR